MGRCLFLQSCGPPISLQGWNSGERLKIVGRNCQGEKSWALRREGWDSQWVKSSRESTEVHGSNKLVRPRMDIMEQHWDVSSDLRSSPVLVTLPTHRRIDMRNTYTLLHLATPHQGYWLRGDSGYCTHLPWSLSLLTERCLEQIQDTSKPLSIPLSPKSLLTLMYQDTVNSSFCNP